jgi:hypothetical protein
MEKITVVRGRRCSRCFTVDVARDARPDARSVDDLQSLRRDKLHGDIERCDQLDLDPRPLKQFA